MGIVSSTVKSKAIQIDGRYQVHEQHTDHLGKLWDRFYLALESTNTDVELTNYAELLATVLTKNEINNNVTAVIALGSLASYTLNYSTAAQNFSALREVYQMATQTQAIMIGDFLSSLTNGQLQAAFGLTVGQVTTLRANKLTPAAAAAATILASSGA